MEESHARRLQGRVGIWLLILLMSFTCAQAQDGPARVRFSIPAGDASETLLIFQAQSGYEPLFATSTVLGVRTNSIQGEYEPFEALRLMLEGTVLSMRTESAREAYIERIEPQGPDLNRSTDKQLAAVLEDLQSPPLVPGRPYGVPQAELEEVVVTGTLIRGVQDIVSPLSIVNRRAIAKTGYGSVRDVLQELPLTFGGGPSEDFEYRGNFNRASGINLRGLGAGATLVLVNGRRQPFAGITGDFVDVSSIPWTFVDRIEVLPDGASALYGSDAISGVVNIIMKDRLDGAETTGRVGSISGGGDELVVGHLFGKTWSSGHGTIGYQYMERNALPAAARIYTADSDKTPLGGSDFSSPRSNPGNILDPLTGQPVFALPSGQDGRALSIDDLQPGVINTYNRYVNFDLLPKRRMHGLHFSAEQHLSERASVFAEGRFSLQEIDQQYFAMEQILVVPRSNAFFVDPWGDSPAILVAYNFGPDLGPVVSSGTTRTHVSTAGATFRPGETWAVTVSGSYGEETMRWAGRNEVNPEALAMALADSNPDTAFNPFGDGSHTSPETLERIRYTQEEYARSTVSSLGILADGTLFELPTGAVRLALGSDYRKEKLHHGVRQPQFHERRVSSAFAELAIPLIGQLDAPLAVPRLQLSLAARSERYSDFGTTFNPKIGLQWIPSNALKLRASWGTSFKAPNMFDLYDMQNDLVGLTVLPDPRSPDGRSTVLVRQGSNPELSEETARTWTAGIDLAPATLPGFELSLTYFDVEYDDRVFFLGPPISLASVLADGEWASLVTRNPDTAFLQEVCSTKQFLGPGDCLASNPAAVIDARRLNLSATLLEGLDLDVRRRVRNKLGQFAFTIQGSYLFRFDQAFTDASPFIRIANSVNNPVSVRLRGAIDWHQRGEDLPGFSAGLVLRHSGGYKDQVSERVPRIDSWTSLDLSFGYRAAGSGGTGGWELLLTGTNLFDEHPPFVDRETGYDPANADPWGRMLSFSVRRSW